MKISSFTQTYGDKRLTELYLLQYDTIGNYFRNKCDLIVFSFHNCPEHFIKVGKMILEKIYSKDKLLILTYNNISYLESIRNTIKTLKEKNIDYILQIQDDQHGINTKQNIENIEEINDMFSFIEKYNPELLHIFSDEGDKNINQLTPLDEKMLGNTSFYSYDTMQFKEKNIYAWNDGTYFGRIDLLEYLFNINLEHDVWRIELQLKYIFDNNKFIRWGTNKVYFKASNLHGRNVNNTLSVEDNLKRFFGEIDEWNIIKQKVIKNK
jgi:hypothetical protein